MLSDASLRRWLASDTVRLWGDVIRASAWGAAIVIWIVFAQIYARMIRLTLSDPAHSDFTIFYYTARLVADGFPMYGASPARYGIDWAAGHLGNLNPPHVQALIQPLALLSYPQAFILWLLFNAAALTVSLAVIIRTLGVRLTPGRIIVCGALILSAAPFTAVAITSELTFLLMLPATLAWAAHREGRASALGAWIAVCCAMKLFFLLFVPWLIMTKRWRALSAGILTGAAVTVAGVAWAGFDAYRLWMGSLGQVGWWWLPMNASWQGLVSRVFSGGRSVEPLWHAASLVPPIAIAGSAVIALASVWSAASIDRRGASVDLAFAISLLGAVLASPLGWVYYLPLTLGPVLGLMYSGDWGALRGRWRVVAALALLCLYIPLEQASAGQPSKLATITLASSYFWGAAGLWSTLVAAAWRRV